VVRSQESMDKSYGGCCSCDHPNLTVNHITPTKK
jgi:hypothetical protein